MRIDLLETRISAINRPVTIRIMLPDGYDESDNRYPVLYLNDGQDLLRDEYAYRGAESLRFEQYYKDYGKFVPSVIMVAIEAPINAQERTAQYSPFTKDFIVPAGVKFESRIEGKGKEYLEWMTGELKPFIDINYRTRKEKEYTGVFGYSTGGLISIYAALKFPETFTRLIAMSSAVYNWMDCLKVTLESSQYSHLKYVYMDVGTNEFGRLTTKEQFLDGAETLNKYFSLNGLDDRQLKYNIYPDVVHNAKEWRIRFPDALRWIFQDV